MMVSSRCSAASPQVVRMRQTWGPCSPEKHAIKSIGRQTELRILAKCLILVAVVSLAWLQLRVMHSRSSTGFESSSWFLVSPRVKVAGGGEKTYLRYSATDKP